MQRYNDLNTPMIALVGLLGMLLTFIAVVALQVLYYTTANRRDEQKIVNVPTTASNSLLAEQEVKLTRYGWIARDQDRAAIPIERAMKLVVDELSATQGEEGNRRKHYLGCYPATAAWRMDSRTEQIPRAPQRRHGVDGPRPDQRGRGASAGSAPAWASTRTFKTCGT